MSSPDQDDLHPESHHEDRSHRRRRHRHHGRRYMPGEVYLELPGNNPKVAPRVYTIVCSVLGGVFCTAIAWRVLYLSWNTWDKAIDRYGPRADPLYKDPADTTAAAIVVLAIIFLLATIGLMAVIHRK